MDTITLTRTDDTDLRFSGELIAERASSANNASGRYDGAPGRWREYALYRTAGGRYVGRRISRTIWQGEHDRHEAAALDSDQAVIDWFGLDWLAHELYTDAGIEAVEVID